MHITIYTHGSQYTHHKQYPVGIHNKYKNHTIHYILHIMLFMYITY